MANSAGIDARVGANRHASVVSHQRHRILDHRLVRLQHRQRRQRLRAGLDGAEGRTSKQNTIRACRLGVARKSGTARSSPASDAIARQIGRQSIIQQIGQMRLGPQPAERVLDRGDQCLVRGSMRCASMPLLWQRLRPRIAAPRAHLDRRGQAVHHHRLRPTAKARAMASFTSVSSRMVMPSRRTTAPRRQIRIGQRVPSMNGRSG